jgi:hypothetical protein
MNNRKAIIILIMLLFVVIFTASCGQVLSKNPLPTTDAMIDSRLFGTWATKNNDVLSFVHIGKRNETEYDVFLINFNTKESFEHYEASISTIATNSENYMNIKLTGASVEGGSAEENDDFKNNYLIAKYMIDASNKLHIHLLNSDKFYNSKYEKELDTYSIDKTKNNDGSKKRMKKISKNYIVIDKSSNDLKRLIEKKEQDTFKNFCVYTKIR